jgi:transposase
LSAASKPLPERDQSILEEIKPAVSEAVFERLNESIRRKEELLERLQRENKLLRELRRLDLIEKYGPSAETLSDEQLELLELEPGVSCSEIEAERQRTQLSLPLKAAAARRHPGRQQLPAELPREEQVIACNR